MYISNIEDRSGQSTEKKLPRKASTIMKKPKPLHLKNSQSLKKSLTPSEKCSTLLK